MKTFLWYDLETFGLDKYYDRIAQVAYLRTDLSFRPIGKPEVIYSKLSPDYLPSPDSCLITGITPDIVNEKGIPECEMIRKFLSELTKPDTISVGYNNIRFDDECIRATLYRNFHNQFDRGERKGCTRWDLINVVRAAHDISPDGLIFDKRNPDTGTVSFVLTDLTEENKIEQEGAHDALVDVYATMNLAKKIAKNSPEFFDYCLKLRYPNECWRVMDEERHPVFLQSSSMHASESSLTHPLVCLFRERKNDFYCFDLSYPVPDDFDYESEDGLFKQGLCMIKANQCPIVMRPEGVKAEALKRIGYDRATALERRDKALRLAGKREEILSVIKKPQSDAQQEERDPDITLFSPFPTCNDQDFLKDAATMTMDEKAGLLEMEERGIGRIPVDDPKYKEMLFRQVARNHPELLGREGGKRWKEFVKTRLQNKIRESALTLDSYFAHIDEKLSSEGLSERDMGILLSLKDYGERLKAEFI